MELGSPRDPMPDDISEGKGGFGWLVTELARELSLSLHYEVVAFLKDILLSRHLVTLALIKEIEFRLIMFLRFIKFPWMDWHSSFLECDF